MRLNTITMPEANQIRNTTHSAAPRYRCTTISVDRTRFMNGWTPPVNRDGRPSSGFAGERREWTCAVRHTRVRGHNGLHRQSVRNHLLLEARERRAVLGLAVAENPGRAVQGAVAA